MASMLTRKCWRGYKRWLRLYYITKYLIPLTFGKLNYRSSLVSVWCWPSTHRHQHNLSRCITISEIHTLCRLKSLRHIVSYFNNQHIVKPAKVPWAFNWSQAGSADHKITGSIVNNLFPRDFIRSILMGLCPFKKNKEWTRAGSPNLKSPQAQTEPKHAATAVSFCSVTLNLRSQRHFTWEQKELVCFSGVQSPPTR